MKIGKPEVFKTAYAVLCGPTSSPGAIQPVASVGTSGQVLTSNGAGALPTFQTLPYVCLWDEKAQNTNGGTFTAGDWRTRDITTEASDDAGLCTLSSNQITLSAGTYIVRAIAPANQCSLHQARLYNVTDGAIILLGTNSYSNASYAGGAYSEISGKFTIVAGKALEVQHYCSATRATDGFGAACNFGVERYTTIEFWKVG